MRRSGTLIALVFLIAIAAGPLILLFVQSFASRWFWPALLPPAWTARPWQYVLSPQAGVAGALLNSVGIACAVAAVAVLAGLPAARALAFYEFRGKRAVWMLLLAPLMAPPLAATMGLHGLFLRLGLAETLLAVVLVHLMQSIPYATLVLAGAYAHFDRDLEAVARNLGAAPRDVFLRVTLPVLAPGIAVAAGFSFLVSWSQYLTTLLIGGARIQTLPLTLVSFQRGGDEGIAAALSIVFVAPAIGVLLLSSRYLR